jgi:hypothetical protein
VSKAYRAIVSDAKVLPYSQDGLHSLQSKNPAVSPGKAPWTWDEENPFAEEPVPIAFDSVIKLIRSVSKGASCGVDNFPVDILSEAVDEDNGEERIPYGYPAFLGPPHRIPQHSVHPWPMSFGGPVVL